MTSPKSVARTTRLVSDSAASAYILDQWINRDAARLATAIHWGVYPAKEALAEIQGLARLAAVRAGGLDCSANLVARAALAREFRRQRNLHDVSSDCIRVAVLQVLRSGGDRKAVLAAASFAAISQSMKPPPWLIAQVAADAADEFRAAEGWWSQRVEAA